MDFRRIDEKELKELAEFFVVDVTAVDEDAPTKKELIASFKALSEEDAVSDDDYAIFLKSKEDAAALAESAKAEPVKKDELPDVEAKKSKYADVDKSDWVLLKFEGNNPRIDLLGFTFQKKHPFQQVPEDVAAYAVTKSEGFRLALPSELADFYN